MSIRHPYVLELVRLPHSPSVHLVAAIYDDSIQPVRWRAETTICGRAGPWTRATDGSGPNCRTCYRGATQDPWRLAPPDCLTGEPPVRDTPRTRFGARAHFR